MPVGFSSPARNLFLLGSSGAQVVSNFFESISKASTTDGVFIPDEIRYIADNKKYALAGSAQDSNSKGFGWLERQDYDLETGALTTDYSNRIESTLPNTALTLRAVELDSNNNLIVVGFSGTTPWIAKYSNDGVLDWQSTTASANVRYLGVTSDSNNNYYACGRTSYAFSDTQAFVEKFDSNGNPGWGKQAFMLGRDVVLAKISANDRGEVVAVGFLEDDSANKGYIVKIDTNTGEVLWDRTLERNISGYGGSALPSSGDGITPADVKCTACYIDSKDQIYVVGSIDGKGTNDNGVGEFLIKYSPEGNIVWQRERDTRDFINNPSSAPNTVPFDVKSDGETEQTVVLSVDSFATVASIELSKYSKNGDLVFRRRINKSGDQLGAASLDADPSFYYFIFRDQAVDALAGEPDRYTFGKVSTSGNGLGAFQYDDGTATLIDYTVVSNAENKIGRLSDGSVTNSVSDLMTYPFTANKLLFDDLATHVSNKKRQMDDADSFEYSGSPAIRPADFQELNLLGSTGFEDVTTSGGGTTTQTVTWSNDLTTANPANGFFSAATLAFDGGSDTSAATSAVNGGNQIVWSPSQFPAADGPYTLEVLARAADNNGGWGERVLKVNGTTVFDPAVNTLPTGYVTVSNLSEITEVIVERSSGTSGRSRLDTIKVNGTELIDGQQITVTVPGTTTAKVKDQSGKGNDGIAYGATHNAAGYWEFDGVDDTIQTDPISFDVKQKTLECWVKLDSITQQGGGAIGICTEDGGIFDTIVYNETGNGWGFGSNGFARTSWSGVSETSTADWTHIVATYDDNDYRLFRNGVQIYQETSYGALTYTAGTITAGEIIIGRRHGLQATPVGPLDASIGEARFYPRVLTAAQVFQNYNATKSKYINEAPDTAPKIGPGIVYGSDLLLNYDFGNRATYDSAENLVRNSNDLSSSYWQIGGSQGIPTRTQDALSPVGDLTAWTVDDTATGADGQGMDGNISGLTASSTQTYTMSVYAKQGTAAKFDMYCFFKPTIRGTRLSYTWDTNQIFTNNSDNGGADAVSSGQEYVGNGWYRIWMEVIDSTLGTNTEIEFRLYPASRETGPTGSTLFWNPQVVRGSNPGRSIKTYGSAITAPTTVKNLSSSSYTGTLNGPTFDLAGRYFETNGSGDTVTVDGGLSLSATNGFTVEFWVKLTGLQSNNAWNYFVYDQDGISPPFYEIGIYSNSSYFFRFKDNSIPEEIFTELTQNQWHHVCFGLDTSSLGFIYRDGQSQAVSTNSFGGPLPLSKFFGGQNTTTIAGQFGEIRAYDRQLTATEVSQNFNATRGKYGV